METRHPIVSRHATEEREAPRPADAADAPQARGEPRDSMRFHCGSLDQHWYIAATSNQVTARRPVAATILEEPIVLFRGTSGEAVALLDRCAHRNAPLSEGRVSAGCVSCPYHGWTFDARGECVRVPSEGCEATPRAARRIERFPTVECDGFVWVWMGRPEHAGERAPFRFPHLGERGWGSYVMCTSFEGDVTDLVENFMDVPHTSFVHAGWFRSERSARRAAAVVDRTADAVHVEYFQPEDSIGFARWLLNPDRLPMTHTDRFFMPNVTRVDYRWSESRALVITSQITPVTRDRAIVYTGIAFRFGILTPIARLLLPPYTRAVIAQDVRIMRSQTRNLAKFGRRRFAGTEADAIHRAVEALRAFAERGDDGPTPAPRTTRIEFVM